MADDDTTLDAADEARENVNEPPADPVLAAAAAAFPEAVAHESAGQPVIFLARDAWADFARWLHDDQGFDVLSDLCGVDHLLNAGRAVPAGVTPERFEVVANLTSFVHGGRLRAICEVPAADPVVPTLTGTYPGADWPERETFDLFGIRFDGHPDLTRILLPEDWQGHPLRKDDAPARVPVMFKGPGATPFQQARGR